MKVGVWYEARLKGNSQRSYIVQILERRREYRTRDGRSIGVYAVIFRGTQHKEEMETKGWHFRELSGLEQELE